MGYGSCWMTAPVLAAPAIEGLLGVEPRRSWPPSCPSGSGIPAAADEPLPVEDVLEFREAPARLPAGRGPRYTPGTRRSGAVRYSPAAPVNGRNDP